MNQIAPRLSSTHAARTGGAGIGVLLHRPRLHEFFIELALLGRAPSFRSSLLELAQIRPGEAVLDIGCGAGSLALLAREAVGANGTVCGVDASAEMIAWARNKAQRAGAQVDFRLATAQALPFPEASFDVVLSTLMLHHLPKRGRAQLAAEARRVGKPGGRVLVVDFAEPAPKKGLHRHLQHRHGGVALPEILQLLEGTGARIAASGPVGVKNVQFALAELPAAD